MTLTRTPAPSAAAHRPVALLVLAHAVTALTTVLIATTLIAGLAAGQPLSSGLPFVLLLAVTLGVGWLLAVRVPRNPVAWILVAIPTLFTVGVPLGLLGEAVRPTVPEVARWIDWYNGTDTNTSWAWLPPVWLLLAQLPLRFPDGQLPSPRWRWFSWFTVGALVVTAVFIGTSSKMIGTDEPNPAYLPAVAQLPFLYVLCFGLIGLAFLGSVGSLFVRYRRAAVGERAQLRWMLWAVALAVTGLVLSWLLPDSFSLVQAWVLVLYGLIPVAVAIAVLRYRLYEIDRIISRTAAYAIVSLVVVGTYASIVLLAGLLLPGLASVGVALATLTAAAVFLPVLRWVRRVIDRVFNRSQYDAERVVDVFGERIRNGADPHTAGVDLVGAVGETLQPSAIGLWTPRGAE